MAREFEWSLLTVPDAMAMVRGQLGFSWGELARRLETLGDDEFTWRPAAGALSVVPRGEVAPGRRGIGAGDWVVEWPADATGAELGGPEAGTRTIAWLVAHLTEVFAERWDWTFGGHRLRREHLTYQRERTPAVAQLVHWVDRWQEGVDAMDPTRVYEASAPPPRSTHRRRSDTWCCTSTASSCTTVPRSARCRTCTGRPPRQPP